MKLPIHPRKMAFLLPCLLVIAFLVVVFWPASPPSAEDIAIRGKYRTFPLEHSVLSPGSWKVSSSDLEDWIDEGSDALRSLRLPTAPQFRNDRTSFFEHLRNLRFSDDPADRAEYQRLVKLGEPWFQNLLNRYPELKLDAKKLPDERNAMHRLTALQERLGIRTLIQMSQEIQGLLPKREPWNPEKAQAWLDAHRDLIDDIRKISHMTESSIICLEYKGTRYPYWFGDALLLEARLSAEYGDWQAALENVRAASGLSRLVRNAEGADFAQNAAGSSLEGRIRDQFLETILPTIPPEKLDLAAWRDALRSEPRSPADFTDILKAEWNTKTRYELIPALVDPAATDCPPDAEYLVQAYTEYMAERVAQYADPVRAAAFSWTDFDSDSLSRRGTEVIDSFAYSFHISWYRSQLRTGLTQAAFDILEGKPVPCDPVHGLPYQWNPETRELSLSRKQVPRDGARAIKLPKL